MSKPKKYMTVNNIKKIEKRLDNATSELWNALELFTDMDFTKMEGEEISSLQSVVAKMESVSIYFENIVSIKNDFEEIREELEEKKLRD